MLLMQNWILKEFLSLNKVYIVHEGTGEISVDLKEKFLKGCLFAVLFELC